MTTRSSLSPASIGPACSPPPRLAELVKQFRVCWEVWPEYLHVSGVRRQVGFELVLCGTHEPDVTAPVPGCPHCHPVFEALQEIAAWLPPKDVRSSKCEVGGYDAALRYTALRQNRPDVTLSLKILHREHIEDRVDDCQIRFLEEMKTKLRALKAPEGRWSAHTT